MNGEALIYFMALAVPRAAGFLGALPFLRSPLAPGLARNAIILAIAVPLAPQAIATGATLDLITLTPLALKEAVLGFLLSAPIALLFLVAQGTGDIIDNQRGASIGSAFNPALGDQAGPLGILLSQAFMVGFLLIGGARLLVDLLYATFEVYPMGALTPNFSRESVDALMSALEAFLRLAVVLAAPVALPMLLAELGLGLAGRFAPQLNVFFVAMSLKSVLALALLILYLDALMKILLDIGVFDPAQSFLALALDYLAALRPVDAPVP